jgi:oligopeptide/dipeptide ABC transporter ATP-binding protein
MAPLLEVDGLTVKYATDNEPVTAVSEASFTIDSGDYFGLTGESGCGKTTVAKAIMGGLDENGWIESGSIRLNGREIHTLSESEFRDEIRFKEISWIPQGSMNSLDPLQKIGNQAVTIAKHHSSLSRDEALEKFTQMCDIVGLQESRIMDYPHELSGGMQQRVLIAMALFLEPALIIADEPTTALDVIMQDQVFKYLDRVNETTETSLLLITHDISVIFESCDLMTIMHSGQTVETASVQEIATNPRHPYTVLLSQAFPDIRYPDQELTVIEGSAPQPHGTVDYCTFADRCPLAVEECTAKAPPTERLASETDSDHDHVASCIRSDDIEELRAERSEQVVSDR